MLTGPRIIAGRRPLIIVRLIGVSALQGPSYATGAAGLIIDASAGARLVRRTGGAGQMALDASAGARLVRRAAGASACGLSASGAARRARRVTGASSVAISATARPIDDWAAKALSRMTSPPADFITRLDAGARILRAAGVLDLLDALWLCGSYSRTAARLNLCSSSYALTEFNTPTWTAWTAGAPGGFTGGGTAYLDSGANPSTNFTKASLNSATYGVWYNTAAQQPTSPMGDANNRVLMLTRRASPADSASVRVHGATTITTAGGSISDGRGLLAGNRSGADACQLYKNGAALLSSAGASTAMPVDLALLRQAGSYNAGQVSAAFAGASLTAAQHLALYRGIAAMLGGAPV